MSRLRLHDDRHEVELGPFGAAARGPASQSSGAWNSERGRCLRPGVRSAHELDRACIRPRLVQRDPAGDHLRRDEVVRVGGVLVEADRLRSGRLPEDVVLEDPHAAVSASRAASLPVRSESTCAATTVSDFQALQSWRVRSSGRGPAPSSPRRGGSPSRTGRRRAARSAREAARARGWDETFLDDEKAVSPERLDLLGCERVDQDRGRVLSGS